MKSFKYFAIANTGSGEAIDQATKILNMLTDWIINVT